MKKISIIFILLASVFIVTSCSQEVVKHDVYVTVYPMEYIVKELFNGTDKTVDIVPGTTSHEISVEWAPKEIIAMKDAELLLYIGANYDQYIDKKLNVFEDANVDIIKIEDQTDYIEYIPGVIHEHDHETEGESYDVLDTDSLGLDPHFWISPKRMLDVLELVHDLLIQHFPEQAEKINDNYHNLKSDLEELHVDFEEGITAMDKPALTSTNLYGYLEADYGLEFIPISSGYHEKPDELLPDDSAHIIDEVEFHQISIIIYEKNKTSPASDNIYGEMSLSGYNPIKKQFNILQALSDEDISQSKDYISEMRANLSILIDAGR